MTSADVKKLRPHLQNFELTHLMIDGLGWNNPETSDISIKLNEGYFTLKPIAERAGFVVYLCTSDRVPLYPVRRKIERRATRVTFEHMIIFADNRHSLQIWQWVKREEGVSDVCHEVTYYDGQPGDSLLQQLRGLKFDLEDAEHISGVIDVVKKALDVEKVTKQFYKRFERELTSFQSFIKGIDTRDGSREWYASLMLNRMMFIYFVQKQGFLDGDHDYLRNRLERVRAKSGRGRFQQFYRLFLLRLFHEGLAKPESDRAPDLTDLLGRVPYLNGGLFDIHDLERDNQEISIPDEAFESIFKFFDEYKWNLDWRPNQKDDEINPDVLGYIFEKYINQKQMGAYYTKEDITGYISRNTVIPFLFDAAKKECPVAFIPDGGVWRLLRDDPDRYIYPAVGHGVAWNVREAVPQQLETECKLPEEITVGIDDVSKRDKWNQAAPSEYALPTETWREVVARRQRYHEVRSKLASGEIQDINDLVTLNLNVERFAKDVIVQSEGPELLRAFWLAMRSVSILDPTCGSGAFLFAALNVVEPLYTACLEGMQGFLDDLERSKKPRRSEALEDFQAVLGRVRAHPNRQYYVLKSIVINNLYGVDIMEEAVEICKLRLFLKLMAQLKSSDQIEPLPDIDFNIRAGNTLVGFTSLDAVQNAMQMATGKQSKFMTKEEHATLPRIKKAAEIANQAFDRFRSHQTDPDAKTLQEDKEVLRSRLDVLRDELDTYLAAEYKIESKNSKAYEQWRNSHQPFHWFVEFYGIMNRGGFDVVVGNPPYVEYGKVKGDYTVKGYKTESCGNLYAMVMERSVNLSTTGHFGMIVPASAMCTDGYASLRELLIGVGGVAVSSYSDNPGRLFDGLPHNRLQIILLNRNIKFKQIFTTTYNKWRPNARPYLFHNLVFFESTGLKTSAGVAKIGYNIEASLLQKINRVPLVQHQLKLRSSKYTIYYTRKLSHFLQILNFIPKIYDVNKKLRKPSELKEVQFDSTLTRDGVLGILNSSLFFWLVTVFSDCRNLNQREINVIKFDMSDNHRLKRLASISNKLMEDVNTNSELKKQGDLIIQCTFPRQSKIIIDKLDAILANHYNLTDAELDFIVNYDIKYRMRYNLVDDAL